MGRGLRGLIAAGAPLLQRDAPPFEDVRHFVDALHFVGAPPSGRWVLVCEAQSRRGRRSYRETPRPLWVFRILCGAPHFVGAPPSGRWVVVCKA